MIFFYSSFPLSPFSFFFEFRSNIQGRSSIQSLPRVYLMGSVKNKRARRREERGMNRHRCNVKKEKSIVASEIKWTEWKRQGNRNSLRYSIFNALSKRLKRETKESQRRLGDA